MSASKLMATQTALTVSELEDMIDKLSQELYTRAERSFRPRHPWVFVRIVSKEQMQNGLYLPASGQNKTVHEGIVLAEYAAYTDDRGKVRACSVAQGGRVLLPHWAGLPVIGYSENRYRIVKEGDLLATVEYNEYPIVLEQMLENLLSRDRSEWLGHEVVAEVSDFASRLRKQFLLVDRDAGSVTLSGR